MIHARLFPVLVGVAVATPSMSVYPQQAVGDRRAKTSLRRLFEDAVPAQPQTAALLRRLMEERGMRVE